MNNILLNLRIAFESILANKFRAFLTAIGVSFGIASVISMLAIGKGAKQEIVEAIEQIGTNNIVIETISEEENNNQKGKKEYKAYSPGLTLYDVEVLEKGVEYIEYMSSYLSKKTSVIYQGNKIDIDLVGINGCYFDIFNFKIAKGSVFTSRQESENRPVCIISDKIARKIFLKESPIGKMIKCHNHWFKIVGVLANKNEFSNDMSGTGLSFENDKIYIPINSMILKIENRKSETKTDIGNQMFGPPDFDGPMMMAVENKNRNELDRIYIKVNDKENVAHTVSFAKKLLGNTHNGIRDFRIIVPETLMKQQEKSKNIFNLVLAIIAGISLLIGGIGIMNVTYTSVLERIQEIGVRLAIGASKKDIQIQFLLEAVLVSLIGGVVGIFLGIAISKSITFFTDVKTIISIHSLFISFFVSVSTGMIFGYMPAKNASLKNPIESLRHE